MLANDCVFPHSTEVTHTRTNDNISDRWSGVLEAKDSLLRRLESARAKSNPDLEVQDLLN